ncbi:MAG: rubrerythrin family protein [Mycoplasma sp.]|nr:rubrerythrin family protein [Mycoplasma sp.]
MQRKKVVDNKFKDFKKSKTFKNLLKAFEGECKACVKYQYYSSKAKKDGFVQIASFFAETSNNEKEHAKIWLKLLLRNNQIPSTLENLKDAANGEYEETTHMYQEMAKVAKQEGYKQISELFSAVGEIEKEHYNRYVSLINSLKKGTTFKSTTTEKWICINCGNVFVGKSAPKLCPVCKHPQAYYKRLKKDY